MTDIIFALLGPGIDSKVEIALCIHITLEGNVPRSGRLPALSRREIGDALPCHGVFASGFVGVCGRALAAIGPCMPVNGGILALRGSLPTELVEESVVGALCIGTAALGDGIVQGLINRTLNRSCDDSDYRREGKDSSD